MSYFKEHRLVIILGALYFAINLVFFNRYFPPTDGWWETYGYLYLKGIKPYVEMNLAFPPLFVIYNSLLVHLFGTNFLLFRFIGVVETTLNLIILYCFLKNYFSRTSSAISAFVASVLLFSDPVFIAKDYHTFMEIFVGLSLFLFSSITSEETKDKQNHIIPVLLCLLLGGAVAAVGFTKQNVGAFLFLGVLISIALMNGRDYFKKAIKLSAYILGVSIVCVSVILWLHYSGITISDFLQALFQNNAKGSVATVLFRFVTDKYNLKVLSISVLLLCLWRPCAKLYSYAFSEHERTTGVTEVIFIILLMYSMVSAAFPLKVKFGVLVFIVPLVLAIFFYAIYYEFSLPSNQHTNVRFVVFPLLMLAYTCTHSSSFNLTGLFFVVAFSIAYAVDSLSRHMPQFRRQVFLLAISVVPGVFLSKIINTYSWWGLQEGGLLQAKYALPYTQLKGIYTDKCTEDFFVTVKKAIQDNSKSSNDVYLFPHIPIFYLLENKVPPTSNMVQWFDVITSRNMASELAQIKLNPPRLAIVVAPPKYVFQGHYYLLKRDLLQRDMLSYFDSECKAGRYRILSNKIITPNLGVGIPSLDPKLNVEVLLVPDRSFVGKKVEAFYNALHYNIPDAVIESVISRDVKVGIFNPEESLISDKLTFLIKLPVDAIAGTLGKLGIVYTDDYYMLRIYRRNSMN